MHGVRTTGIKSRTRIRVVMTLICLYTLMYTDFDLCGTTTAPHRKDFSLARHAYQSSKIAYCSVGLFSTLISPQIQMNLKSFVLEPLKADYFAHLDVSTFTLNEKDILLDPRVLPEDIDRFENFLKPLNYSLSAYKFDNEGRESTRGCQVKKTIFAHAKPWKPLFYHIRECYKMMAMAEISRGRKYEWIIFGQSDVLYLTDVKAFLELRDVKADIHTVVRQSVGEKSEFTGEFTAMRRSLVERFISFADLSKDFPCHRCNISRAIRGGTPECVLQYFIHEHVSTNVHKMEDPPLIKQRRCGGRDDCLTIAKLLNFTKAVKYHLAVRNLYD